MNTPATVEVNVVFDGSKRRPGGRVRRTPLPGAPSRGSARLAMAVGIVTTLVAGAVYYGTWWRADPFIYMTFMLKTPVAADVDVETAAAAMFGVRAPTTAPTVLPSPQASTQAPQWSAQTKQIVISSMGYAWLMLATLAACALALAGGAVMAFADGGKLRRVGLILTILMVTGIGLGGYFVWMEYGRAYEPTHLRVGMGLLVLLCGAIGLRLDRRSHGLLRLGAVALILSAAGSAIGLYLWGRCDAIEPEYYTIGFIATVFAIHSLWGWVLIPLRSRL